MLGLRPIGIFIATLAAVAAAARVCWVYYHARQIDQMMIGAGIFSLILLLLWVFRFSPEWVRVPADAYAYRLIETIDMLSAPKSKAKP